VSSLLIAFLSFTAIARVWKTATCCQCSV